MAPGWGREGKASRRGGEGDRAAAGTASVTMESEEWEVDAPAGYEAMGGMVTVAAAMHVAATGARAPAAMPGDTEQGGERNRCGGGGVGLEDVVPAVMPESAPNQANTAAAGDRSYST